MVFVCMATISMKLQIPWRLVSRGQSVRFFELSLKFSTHIETGKRRRAEGGFLGADVIINQIGAPVEKRRIGLIVQGAPARENAKIFSSDGTLIGIFMLIIPYYSLMIIGKVTSGCPSPSLKQNIAMGYIKNGFHKAGTEVKVEVRSKMQNAVVSKMPFVPHQYFRG